MKNLFFVMLVCLCGCTTTGKNDVAVEQLLFPNLKHVTDRNYSFSAVERKQAVMEARRRRVEVLYEVVVDHTGQVIKIRTARPWNPRRDPEGTLTTRFMNIVREQNFGADPVEHRYRAFFFPLHLESQYGWPYN